MKKSSKEIFFLSFVFLLGILLRFYRLPSVPTGVFRDEAAFGYNAYSILTTGKDEYGKSFPLMFRSFGDYKMPVYTYLTVLSVRTWGLNVFSTRFFSAFFGSLTVMVVFFLVTAIFSEKRFWLALLSAFIFAVSPWSIFFSRAAFEANVALFFFLTAFLMQIKAFEKGSKIFLFASAFIYSLSTYTYIVEKLLSPVFFLLFSIILAKKKSQNAKIRPKIVLLSFFLFLIVSLPQFFILRFAAGNNRIESLSIIKAEDFAKVESNPAQIFSVLRKPLSLYAAYFSSRNLFFEPDSDPQRSLPELSVFYSWMVIPFFLGFYLLLAKEGDYSKKIILPFLFLVPVPAALTGDPFSTLRALPLIFPLVILISLGIEKIYLVISNKRAAVPLISVFFLLSIAYLVRSIFFLLPEERYFEWNYGYEELAEELKEFPGAKVLIDDPVGVSYIQMLFFNQYPPAKVQEEFNFDLSRYYQMGDWKNQSKVGDFEARPLVWGKDNLEKDILVARVVGISPAQIKIHSLTELFAIIGPDRKIIFNAFITNRGIKQLGYGSSFETP
ncbi:MAG TPA: phospholipid carrier-dependent glycosyltransferase [Clostridia bacterium]|nr:phospholipid carrier-dependent glycosyltransferase [Clostridia bacterium]